MDALKLRLQIKEFRKLPRSLLPSRGPPPFSPKSSLPSETRGLKRRAVGL